MGVRISDQIQVMPAGKGFTLLEVLIAIVITSFIGLGSWQLFNNAINVDERTSAKVSQFSALQRAMLYLERDFQQLAPRPIRDGFGDYQAALKSKEDFLIVEFSRFGWRNPLEDQRSDLQRVAYELDNGQLIRHFWRVMDRAQDSESVQRVLLEEVEKFTVTFLSEKNRWQGTWPTDSQDEEDDQMNKLAELPTAVKVVIRHETFGEITRYFDALGYVAMKDIEVKSSSSNDGDETNGDDNQTNGGEN